DAQGAVVARSPVPGGQESGGFDAAQVPGGGDVRAQPAQRHGAAQQPQGGLQSQPVQLEAAAVQAGQPGDGIAQQPGDGLGDQPGHQPAAQPVPHAVVQEGAAHEGIAAADQLGDLDFRTAVLDVQPDGVADDDHDAH